MAIEHEVDRKQYSARASSLDGLRAAAADPSAAYFPQDFDQIDPEQAFYWDENGKLVLVFDEYTLAAGSMGISEFVIAPEIIRSLIS